ncbi:MAG: endonuclease/exonuclease/phosphatase family protein, partial [Chlamydiota bacterium]
MKLLSLFIACILCCSNMPIPYFTEVICSTQSAIDQKYAQFQETSGKQIDAFIRYSQNAQSDEAYREWSHLCNDFFAFKIQLGWTYSLATEDSVKKYAEEKRSALSQSLSEQLKKRSDLASAFAANAMNAASLSPLQRYMTRGVLSAYQKTTSIPSVKINAALSKLSEYPEATYDFADKKRAQTPSSSSALKVFSANIICFPDQLAYLHGGISHWRNRLEQLAQKSKETGAQILCFQEVWDVDAMQALVGHLQDSYAYFVYNAGNQFASIDADEIGYSSGLFIASQVPLDAIEFTPFIKLHTAQGGARRGALLVTFNAQGQKVSCINTHLQHGYDATAAEIRKGQVLTCHQILQKASQSGWGFLTGDININAFSPEFKESGLPTLFSIPYLKGQTEITTPNSTATNYFLDLVMAKPEERSKVVPDMELLDY